MENRQEVTPPKHGSHNAAASDGVGVVLDHFLRCLMAGLGLAVGWINFCF